VTKNSQPVDQYVGRKVRERRLLVGLSQEKLGELVGVTFQQIQKYEKGANRIGASRLSQIAAVLGVSVAYFFEGDTSERPDPAQGADRDFGDISAFVATHDGVELIRAFVAIPDQATRKQIIQLVRAIAGSATKPSKSAA